MEELLKNDKEELFIEKDKHKFIKIFISLILILGILGGGGYYYYTNYYNNPNYTVSTLLKKSKKELKKELNEENEYNKLKINALINLNMSSSKKEEQTILEILNNLSLQVNAEVDTKLDIYNIELSSKYKDDDFINASTYIENNDLYLKLVNLFDKYIKIGKSEEIKNISNKNINADDAKKIATGILNALEKATSNLNFEREKEKITVDDKEYDVFNNYVILRNNEINQLLINLLENLQNDDEFIHSYKKISDINLQELINYYKENSIQAEYKISLYTTTNPFDTKLVSIQLDQKTSDKKETTTINIISEDELLIKEIDNESTIEIRIKRNGNNIIIDIKSKIDYFESKINMNLSIDKISNISKPDLSNAIDISELTEDDKASIEEKLVENTALTTITDLIQSNLSNNT